ncbi:hypothetical protein IQ07DRAFT_125614 [Pyrenochaeta sp. DS3sAY3a]|nr:hypothetical protein IQ07DRAFT_125614 [Pyrenochaeta sp. DS3sAY3a]
MMLYSFNFHHSENPVLLMQSWCRNYSFSFSTTLLYPLIFLLHIVCHYRSKTNDAIMKPWNVDAEHYLGIKTRSRIEIEAP